MNKQAVLLSAVMAAFVFASAQAQDKATDKRQGSNSMLGSEKKTPAAPAPDASKPESKLGSNAKTKVPAPVGADGAKPGPYGVGLKKVPKKTAKSEPVADAPVK